METLGFHLIYCMSRFAFATNIYPLVQSWAIFNPPTKRRQTRIQCIRQFHIQEQQEIQLDDQQIGLPSRFGPLVRLQQIFPIDNDVIENLFFV
jgi:hypothetical protein